MLGEGGDIDNRLKTRFDALRKPSTAEAQQAEIPAAAVDDPIHTLLRDDALVTWVNVETDRLLRPTADKFDLVAIIQVTVIVTRVTWGAVFFRERSKGISSYRRSGLAAASPTRETCTDTSAVAGNSLVEWKTQFVSTPKSSFSSVERVSPICRCSQLTALYSDTSVRLKHILHCESVLQAFCAAPPMGS